LTHIEPDTSTAAEKASALIDSGSFLVALTDSACVFFRT
jgi:hypothetical protein